MRNYIARPKRPLPTHCKRGHEYTPKNTYVRSDGARVCQACRREIHAATVFHSPAPTLATDQMRRLRDAHADGVTLDDLSSRFAVSVKVVRELVAA